MALAWPYDLSSASQRHIAATELMECANAIAERRRSRSGCRARTDDGVRGNGAATVLRAAGCVRYSKRHTTHLIYALGVRGCITME